MLAADAPWLASSGQPRRGSPAFQRGVAFGTHAVGPFRPLAIARSTTGSPLKPAGAAVTLQCHSEMVRPHRHAESLARYSLISCAEAPKTEKARAVTLPSFAIDELGRLKREQAEELFRLGVRQDGDTLLCARADGEPLQPQSLTHEFPRFLARLGRDSPRVRFHDLRHSHATQLLLAGVHPKVAQERLGHSTISTTLDLYSHISAATMQEDAAATIDAAFRGAITGRKSGG